MWSNGRRERLCDAAGNVAGCSCCLGGRIFGRRAERKTAPESRVSVSQDDALDAFVSGSGRRFEECLPVVGAKIATGC